MTDKNDKKDKKLWTKSILQKTEKIKKKVGTSFAFEFSSHQSPSLLRKRVQSDLPVSKACLVHINTTYNRQGDIDVNELFTQGIIFQLLF